MIDTPLTVAAMILATESHSGQFRADGVTPYITHPVAVAQIIAEQAADADEVVIAAALLHDTVEDTEVSVSDIARLVSGVVADVVAECTNRFTSTGFPQLNRAQRKALELDRLSLVSPLGQTVKLGDMAHNVPGMVEARPGFAAQYAAEKRELWAVLDSGDPGVRAFADEQLRLVEQL